MNSRIKETICFTCNRNNGEHLAGARLIYDTPVAPSGVDIDTYEVEGQRVASVTVDGCEVTVGIETGADGTEVFTHPKVNGPPPGG
ncbi:MAG: hypothetical protein LUF30_04250, partial [Lachnospiraceae bacterium]|nr:hypothetical protein [Lachnospiraceae bacterium]